jgi:type IV secretory pathway VirB2 component (pilin)
MAQRPTKSADSPSLEQSIQIALDAAEASMDVTAEFERISTQFGETSKATQRLEKMSRAGLMLASGIAILAVLIMGVVWQRSSSGLERLAATNTELLDVLVENISNMDQKFEPILALDAQMLRLSEDFLVLSNASQSSDSITALQGELASMREILITLDTLEMAQARTEAMQEVLGDRIATLNGELAMNVSASMQDMLSSQSEAYATLAENFSTAVDTISNTTNTEELAKIQEQMDARVAALNELIKDAQTTSSDQNRPRASPQQEPDIIKFP